MRPTLAQVDQLWHQVGCKWGSPQDDSQERRDWCPYIQYGLKFATLRDRFDNFIHDEQKKNNDDLTTLGIAKVEVLDEGLRFVRKETDQ